MITGKWENRKSRRARELATDLGMSNYDLSKGRVYQQIQLLGYVWDTDLQEWRKKYGRGQGEDPTEILRATILSYERILADVARELDLLDVPANVGTDDAPECLANRRLAWLRAKLQRTTFKKK